VRNRTKSDRARALVAPTRGGLEVRREQRAGRDGGSAMLFGEVGETLELIGVLLTMFSSLAIMVALGKWWES
jgi:hypothetical protein